MVGAGVGLGVGFGVGFGVGAGVGFGVGEGVGFGVGVIVLVCIIGTVYIGKRMYDKKARAKSDEVQLTLPGNIKNTITPIDDDNDGHFPNTTR